jgi:hypothetical protein
MVLLAMAAGTGSFLEKEAGICAYTNVGQSIDFAMAKPVYKTIEREAEEYVIGSMGLPGYAETEDVHVFISKDGWIAAYYLKDEPVSKIIDWNSYQGKDIVTTKLELGLTRMCNTIGVPLVNVKYYDFKCPNANKLMIIADSVWGELGSNTFDIKIPSDITVYEGSWSHYAQDVYQSNITIDENIINSFSVNQDEITKWNHGQITPSQLKPDVFHTISIWYDEYYGGPSKGCVGIALVYLEP